MKINKMGEIPQYMNYTVTCKRCQTEFHFIEGEAEAEHTLMGRFLSIKCPLCKIVVEVKENSIVEKN